MFCCRQRSMAFIQYLCKHSFNLLLEIAAWESSCQGIVLSEIQQIYTLFPNLELNLVMESCLFFLLYNFGTFFAQFDRYIRTGCNGLDAFVLFCYIPSNVPHCSKGCRCTPVLWCFCCMYLYVVVLLLQVTRPDCFVF